ncbi:MAG TPA: DUF4214 domain-containing protein [Magnetospirillaceae bacterium]|nr:DUF4214 domain-containing protein [Magnetospirillaceae bacterium]
MTATIVDLGTLSPHDINDFGEVGGTVPSSGGVVTGGTAGAYSIGGQVSSVSNTATAFLSAVDSVNDLGLLAGYENVKSTGQEAALWQKGSVSLLDAYGGDTNAAAFSINDQGSAVGVSYSFDSNDNFNPTHAVTWKTGTASLLANLAGDSGDGAATGINDSGTIVGYSSSSTLLTDGSEIEHAVMWKNGTATALATVNGEVSGYAHGINAGGQMVGSIQFATGSHAALWQADGSITDLGTLTGYSWAWASRINDLGQVVGSVSTADPNGSTAGSDHAVLWQSGKATDLNTLLPANSGWVLQDALSINDEGQIVGTGTLNGTAASFLLNVNGANSAASPSAGAVQAFQQGILSAPVSLPDTGADVAANIDGLQTLAAAGKLGTVLLIDTTTPTLTLTDAQLTADSGAWTHISGNFVIQTPSATIEGFSGTASQYTVSTSNDIVTVSGNGAAVQLSNVFALQFADQTDIVAAPPDSGTVSTGNVTELYAAVLGREPDVAGLGFYQNYLKSNPATSFLQFAEWFLSSPEYTGNGAHNYAQNSAGDAQFITDSYQNLLHRTPSADEVAYYQTNVMAVAEKGLAAGSQAFQTAQFQAHALMLVYFSASPEFLSDVQVTATHPSDSQHWLVLV